jgi:hypothetical protein
MTTVHDPPGRGESPPPPPVPDEYAGQPAIPGPRQQARAVPAAERAARNLRVARPGDAPRRSARAKTVREVATDHGISVMEGGFSYSTGNPGCCGKCGGLARGLYLGMNFKGPLPYIRSRIRLGTERTSQTHFLMSATPDGPALLVAGEEAEKGGWASRLGMPLSADNRIKFAVSTAINHLAYEAPEVSGTPRVGAKTPDGRIPYPQPEALPEGYFISPADDEIPAAFQRRGLAVMASIARRRGKIALAIGSSVMAPLTGGGEASQSHWFTMYGKPRQGKTSAMMAAASMWGRPGFLDIGGLMRSWNATGLGIPAHLGQLGIFPGFFDETGTADFTPEKWGQVINSTVQGNARTRAPRQGAGSNDTAPWAGVVFTTGNDDITEGIDVGKNAGIPYRVLGVHAPFTESSGEADRLKRAALDSYGQIGPEVIRAFTIVRMRSMIARGNADVGADAISGPERTIARYVGQAVAGAQAAGYVMGRAIAGPDATEDEREETGQRTARQLRAAALAYGRLHLEMTADIRPEGDMARMLSALQESIIARPGAWPDKMTYTNKGEIPGQYARPMDRQVSGFRHADEKTGAETIYVLPRTWNDMVKDEKASSSSALADLFNAGLLDVSPERRKRGEWKGAAPRWAKSAASYRILRSAIFPDDAEGPPPARADGPVQGPPPPPEPPAMLDIPEPDTAAVQADSGPRRTMAGLDPLAARRAIFQGQASARAAKRRAALTPAQDARLGEALAILDAGGGAGQLRALDAMEGPATGNPGPFAPVLGKRAPYFQPPIPPVVNEHHAMRGWDYRREFSGSAVVLDRNAAYPSAMAGVSIVHGDFTESDGASLPMGEVAPGFYLVPVCGWDEPGMPSPLPGKTGEMAWIAHPLMGLLRDLAEEGRWPDAEPRHSFTGKPARLDRWAHFLGELRRYALEFYGADSDQYEAVKDAGSIARSMIQGSWVKPDSGPLMVRQWKCKTRRPDWTAGIAAHSAVTMWRTADKINRAFPGAGTIALRNVDELVIPESALEADMGSDSPIIRMDPSGYMFGTYKIKGMEAGK